MYKISVIIPVYNVEQYLKKCLDSVTNQTYRNLEIILVDDGSTDNSGKICDEYALKDNRIKVIHKQNGGLSSARNAGLDICMGDYIGFVDSDDYIETNMYETLINVSLKYNADVSWSNFYIVGSNKIWYDKILKKEDLCCEISNVQAIEMGFGGLGFYVWNKLFKKNLFDEITFPVGELYEDVSTIFKIFLKSNKIVLCSQPLYYYNNINSESITKQKFNIKKLDYFTATEKILEYSVNEKNKSLIRTIKRARSYMIVGFLRQMINVNFNDTDIINYYIKELRQNILLHLFSKRKLSNKLFALGVCINFNLAKRIYKLLKKQK